MTHNGSVDRANWRGKGSRMSAAAAARRERYAELRRQGTDPWDAAAGADVDPSGVTARRYERWFQAIERGETPLTR